MNRKITFLSLISMSCFSIVLSSISASIFRTYGINNTYSLTISNSNSISGSGKTTFKTDQNNNPVSFSYNNLSSLSGSFASFNKGSYLLNDTMIGDVTSIDYAIDGSLTLYYGYESIDNEHYYSSTLLVGTGSYTFSNNLPCYFKITNEDTNASSLTSIKFNYNCFTNYQPFVVNYHLNGGSLQEITPTLKHSFSVNYVNNGYDTHYEDNVFIYPSGSANQLYAFKIGIVSHNIEGEYIVNQIKASGESAVVNVTTPSDYWIVVHGTYNDEYLPIASSGDTKIKVGDIVRVNKAIPNSSTSSNIEVSYYDGSDSYYCKEYTSPFDLKEPTKNGSTFVGYYSSSSFEDKPIKNVGSSLDVYAKYDDSEPVDENTYREDAVSYMRSMATLKWTPNTTINYYDTDTTYKFVSGTEYTGLPYTMESGRTSIMTDPLNGFKGKLDSDNYTYKGPSAYNTYYGSDCSSSVYSSWIHAGIDTGATYTLLMLPSQNSKILPVGEYKYTNESTSASIMDDYTQSQFENFYSKLMPGDAVVYRSSSGGHVRMVSSVDVVNKKVYVIEQRGFTSSTYSTNTTWYIDHSYSFATLFANHYLPITNSLFNIDKNQ